MVKSADATEQKAWSSDSLSKSIFADIEMSEQSLVSRIDADEIDDESAIIVRTPRKYFVAVAILFAVNLLNYMDRFTIAGVLDSVQDDFNMNDSQAGLLQTAFIVSYMLFAPLFGYLGDRYSRKMIMVGGIFVWSSAVLISSFVPSHHYVLFLLCRATVGIGEASYITVSPTLIADLFTKDMRSKMLMFFYMAVPVGSGLGFVVGANVAHALGSWRWGVRVTPILGLVCVALIIFVLEEPKRGQSEKGDTEETTSSYSEDVMALLRTRSYVLSTFAFTCVAFVAGCLSWWTPNFVIYAVESNGIIANKPQINLIFGAITCVSGLAGVGIGGTWAQKWRHTNPRADPLVCGIGLLVSMPFLYLALNLVNVSLPLAWVLMFGGITLVMFTFTPNTDIMLYIVTPPRRATASALQILISHLLGDAASPYLIGLVSDSLRKDDSAEEHFYSLKIALYINTFVLVIGGGFFLFTAWFIQRDKESALVATRGNTIKHNIMSNSDSVVQGFTNQS